MFFANIAFYLYILLKPFYLFKSGSLQIGDCFLLLSFAIVLLNIKQLKGILKKILNNNKEFIIFLILVILINIIYSIIYIKTDFLLYTSYYIFNFIAILLFSLLSTDNRFINNLNKIIKFNIIIQLVIFILNIGKWYSIGRYMGTFNDPNQFAYFILLSYSWIYLIDSKSNKNSILYLLISIYLIIQSSSTGMLLGISIFIALQLYSFIINMKNDKNLKNKIGKAMFLGGFVLIGLVSVFLIISNSPTTYNNIKSKLSNLTIIERLEGKFNKIDSNEVNLWQERGYDRIYYYPAYTIFGAGEGNFTRWQKAYHQGELHATLPSILFNYGIISLYLVCKWMYKKIKILPFKYQAVYIALLIESFTLLNSRQPLFWLIFILSNYLEERTIKDEIKQSGN